DEIGGAVGQGATDREQISDHEDCLRPGGGPVERLRQGMASAAAARKPVAGAVGGAPQTTPPYRPGGTPPPPSPGAPARAGGPDADGGRGGVESALWAS